MKTHRFIRILETSVTTGLSPSTIDRLEKSGDFPRRRRIGIRAVGWLESEILSWMESKSKKLRRKTAEVNNGL